jgi:putative ABC transport system permease protein
MILRDAIDVSLDNLRQSRLRTFLTTLGVAIGVGSIVGMLAVAIGLQDNLYAQLLRTGFFRRITVWAQGAGGRGEQQQPPRQIDENAILAIRQIPGVKLITREARIPVRLQAGEKTVNTQMTGVILDDADEAIFTDIKQGRFITSNEAREIVLSSQTAKTLGFIDPAAAVGQMIRVRVRVDRPGAGFGFPVPEIPVPEPFELKVVGVVERERALFGDMNARLVYAPQAVIEEQVQFFQTRVPMIMAMVTTWAPLQVRLNDARDVDRVEKEIKGLGFRTISVSSIISNMRRAFIVVDMLLAVIGSMALVVASLGIINTMVMAVLERTREIGVMKAVGAEDGDIRRIFLTESALIGVAGGLAGLLLAWLLGRAMNFGANIYIERQGFRAETLFHIPLWLVGAAMAFALGVSVASGLYPAGRAARIDPARALRHD